MYADSVRLKPVADMAAKIRIDFDYVQTILSPDERSDESGNCTGTWTKFEHSERCRFSLDTHSQPLYHFLGKKRGTRCHCADMPYMPDKMNEIQQGLPHVTIDDVTGQ